MATRERKSPRKRNTEHRPGSRTYTAPALQRVLTILGQQVPVYKIDFPDNDRWGEWRPGYREIHVDRNGYTSDRHEVEVNLHEITHAISDMNLSEKDRLTEPQVTTMAVGFADLLANNPGLVKDMVRLLKQNRRR